MNLEIEIKNSVQLCGKSGKLNPTSIGWSRQSHHRCNLSRNFLRKKKWNYWCITNNDYLFSMTISDIDYAGVVFVYYLDFKTKEFVEKTIITPFGKGIKLGQVVDNDATYVSKNNNLFFRGEEEGWLLSGNLVNFAKQQLQAKIFVERPINHETLNVVIPWSKRRFQFTSKQFCYPAEGTVTIGSKKIEFDKKNSFACLDFGRGVWPYKTHWNWGSFSAKSGSNLVGLNAGAGWTDGTGYTENGIFLNGRIYKLSEDISFSFDKSNLMKPWGIKSTKSNAVDLTFTPFFDRKASSNLLIVSSSVNQMIGHYNGVLRVGRQNEYKIKNAIGWAEEHNARW